MQTCWAKQVKQDKTKAERKTVKRERAGWQCVGGSLLSSFGGFLLTTRPTLVLFFSPSSPFQSVDRTKFPLNTSSSLALDYLSLFTFVLFFSCHSLFIILFHFSFCPLFCLLLLFFFYLFTFHFLFFQFFLVFCAKTCIFILLMKPANVPENSEQNTN